MTSDNELLGLYVYHDDQAAFEKLIRRHGSMVLSVCSSMLWRKEDAEDVFQAVFVLLATKAPKLLKHNSLGGWLHEVAVRMSLKHRGKIARKREVAMPRVDNGVQSTASKVGFRLNWSKRSSENQKHPMRKIEMKFG